MNEHKKGFWGWIRDNKIGTSLIAGSMVFVITMYMLFFLIIFLNNSHNNQNMADKKETNQKSSKNDSPSEKVEKLKEKTKIPTITTSDEFIEISNEATNYFEKGNEKLDIWMDQLDSEGLENVTSLEVESAFNEYSDAAELLLAIEPPSDYIYEYNELISINNDYINSINYYNEAIESNDVYTLIEAAKLKSRADNKLKDLNISE